MFTMQLSSQKFKLVSVAYFFSYKQLVQAKRQLRCVIWGEFRASGKLCTAFFTGFGILTIRANFKQNDGSAECFDANFKQQDNCARCFGQLLAF